MKRVIRSETKEMKREIRPDTYIWLDNIISSTSSGQNHNRNDATVDMITCVHINIIITHQPQWQMCWWWHSCYQWTLQGLQSWSEHLISPKNTRPGPIQNLTLEPLVCPKPTSEFIWTKTFSPKEQKQAQVWLKIWLQSKNVLPQTWTYAPNPTRQAPARANMRLQRKTKYFRRFS